MFLPLYALTLQMSSSSLDNPAAAETTDGGDSPKIRSSYSRPLLIPQTPTVDAPTMTIEQPFEEVLRSLPPSKRAHALWKIVRTVSAASQRPPSL